MSFDWWTAGNSNLLVIAGTFLLAGWVKGVVGFGLPTVSLGLLTASLGLHPAMALLLAPSFVTNACQAVAGAHARELLRRIWPFLLTAALTIGLGAQALSRLDVASLSALLGVLLIAYALLGLARPPPVLPLPCESWAGPLAGAVNGVLTGMTGSFVVPGVLYLQALGLPRDKLIQAMGMLFSASTVALGIALGGHGLLPPDVLALSTAAVAPALAGMILGQRLRKRLPETLFKKLFFLALLLLGGAIILRQWPA